MKLHNPRVQKYCHILMGWTIIKILIGHIIPLKQHPTQIKNYFIQVGLFKGLEGTNKSKFFKKILNLTKKTRSRLGKKLENMLILKKKLFQSESSNSNFKNCIF